MQIDNNTTERGQRSGGRAARVRRRSEEATQNFPACISRKIPVYELLEEEALQQLEAQADWILKEVGVEVSDDQEALSLLRKAGASVKGNRVRFEPGLARSLCASAPCQFQLHARDPARTVTIGGNHVVMSPASGPPMVTDMDRGRRKGSIDAFRDFVKLAESTSYLHHAGATLCEPEDIALNKRHLDMVYNLIRYSSKPFMGSSAAPERAVDSIRMAELVFGEAFVKSHCVITTSLNINSPLTLDHITTGVMKIYARANQGVLLSPFMMSGAMSPVTQPASIAQLHAECMAGIALYQLFQKGAPIIYGNFLTTLDLKTGAPTFGTAEANLSALAVGQLSRRLGVPLRCGGHLTASKIADGQAMQESADSMTAGLLAGANFVLQAAGWLESGMTIGYEKFVMDIDRCGMMQRMLAGLILNENELAKDAYREAGPGQTYLGTNHTQRNFESANYTPDLADTDPYEHWLDNGSQDIQQRANRRWKEVLAQFQAPAIDPGVNEALQEFVARRKREMPDEWY